MTDTLHIVCPSCAAVNRLPRAKLGARGKCGQCRAALFPGRPIALSHALFGKHVESNGIPVLVDFWAAWCAPCKMMEPVFEQAAMQLEPYVRLARVNTEEEHDLALQHSIRSIPTLILFAQGRESARISGAMDLHSLLAWTREHL
jgi:thioredoxin 2